MDWIRRLFCKHKWIDISGEIKVYGNFFDGMSLYYKRVFVCKKCLKERKIKY